MTNLCPCPFCGQTTGKLDSIDHEVAGTGYYISCIDIDCGADGPIRMSPIGAAAAWNRAAIIHERIKNSMRELETVVLSLRADNSFDD